MAKLIVGLTGGIGSGKSTVARLFAELGVALIDADQLARDVVEPGTDGLAKVVAAFGDSILNEDLSLDRQALDRQALGDVVFGDDEARATLNGILHPLIAMAGASAIGSLQDHPGAFILYEAALLVENGAYKIFNSLIVVSAKKNTQIERVTSRDGLTVEQAQARIDAQLSMAEKEKVADHIIRNDGTLEELKAHVNRVYKELATMGTR